MKTKFEIRGVVVPMCFVFLIFTASCKKDKSEGLKVRNINNKTILKNHSDGVDYYFDNLEVNGELIIEAGVHIQVSQDALINVSAKGLVKMMGSRKEPIIMEGKNTEMWQGIDFQGGSHELNNVKLKNAGSRGVNFGSIVAFNNTKIKLNEVNISYSGEGSAIIAEDVSNITVGSGCTISHVGFPYKRTLTSVIQINSAVRMEHVALECIMVKNPSEVKQGGKFSLKNKGLPYLLGESLSISDYQLTIEAGITVLIPESFSINVVNSGMLNINGSFRDPIIFKSVEHNKFWDGFNVSNGRINMLYANINKVKHKLRSQGVITLHNHSKLYISRSDMRNNSTPCDVVAIGNAVINPDYDRLNSFNSTDKLCQY